MHSCRPVEPEVDLLAGCLLCLTDTPRRSLRDVRAVGRGMSDPGVTSAVASANKVIRVSRLCQRQATRLPPPALTGRLRSRWPPIDLCGLSLGSMLAVCGLLPITSRTIGRRMWFSANVEPTRALGSCSPECRRSIWPTKRFSRHAGSGAAFRSQNSDSDRKGCGD